MKKLALLFKLTAHEQRGFLLLLCFIVLLQFVPLFHRVIFRENNVLEPLVHLEEFKREGHLNVRLPEDISVHKGALHHENTYSIKPFNPNNLPEAAWRMMGFSDKQISVIKNYERKGGLFRSASDVKKIYSISEVDFRRIVPFLRFDESPSDPHERIWKPRALAVKESVKVVPLYINDADTLAWQMLPGIGTVLSNRIVKFRDLLGGFHSVDQLAEVYGVTPETFAKFKDRLLLGETSVKQLLVNQLSEQELARHPYISSRNARYIVRYREQHGALQSMADLKNIYALDPDFLLKIEPYLQFN